VRRLRGARDAGRHGHRTEWTAVNACLLPVAALDGQEVVTAEGLGTPDDLHPVQAELAGRGGSQCGFCTPGFVCSMAAEYYRPDRRSTAAPTAERGGNGFDLHAIGGNLCRCTGYRPIRDAAFALGAPADGDPLAARSASAPPPARATRIVGAAGEFVRPADLAGALALLSRRPDATVVAGSTDWGVAVNLLGARAPLTVAVEHLPSCGAARGRASLEIGGALSLTEVETGLAGRSAARRAAAAVRLPAHPQPRDDRRQPRHRLARRRPRAGTARRSTRRSCSSRSAGAEVPLSDYFTGYRTSVRPRRAGPRRSASRCRCDDHVLPEGRQAPVRRHLQRGSRLALDITGASSGAPASAWVASPPSRCVRSPPRPPSPVGRWDRETVDLAAQVLATEGSPIDDHRAAPTTGSRCSGRPCRGCWRRPTGRRSRHERAVDAAR
jgi:xanthine dehydrogenase small subunit